MFAQMTEAQKSLENSSSARGRRVKAQARFSFGDLCSDPPLLTASWCFFSLQKTLKASTISARYEMAKSKPCEGRKNKKWVGAK